MELQTFASIEALPSACQALFPTDPLRNLTWYRTASVYALPTGSAPCFVVLSHGGAPCAVVPLAQHERGRVIGSLTTPYTCMYMPVLTLGTASIEMIGQQLGKLLRGWPTVRLDAIPLEWPELPAFTAGLRASGLYVQRFDHFANWQEKIRGRSWASYLADRPGALRETIRRKLRNPAWQFVLFDGSSDVAAAIAAFEAVYRASWKQPEPFSHFNGALIRALAAQGVLRLGVLSVGERAAAVQFWSVAAGHATLLKLAHDEFFKPLSPGTVLTALMLRRLMDDEHVSTLDFGRGDDPYKSLWTTERHKRVGLMLMNPARPAGLWAICQGMAGQMHKAARGWAASNPPNGSSLCTKAIDLGK